MLCPSVEVLRQCLENDGSEFDPSVTGHIATCQDCQQRLNLLSDDQLLAGWRDVHQSTPSGLLEEAACQSVVTRMQVAGSTDRLEAVDALRDTVRIDDLKLDAALITGDLGRLGSYRIIRQLGQGGMAVVLEAIDARLERAVAVKVLRPDRINTRERERFVREAQALAKIRHANVVHIYDVADPSDGPPYFVTELMHGTLRNLFRNRAMEPRSAARILAAVADGLQAAHDVGLVHRDIKPSNILLSKNDDNSDPVPKLSDFGLARALDSSVLTTHTVGLSGTPAYMSPEQITTPQSVTIATDIYSLGVTLYEAICGELPFRGPAHAVLNQIVQEDVPWPHLFNPQVPRELEVICLKALEREPHSRYVSASQFAQDLRNWLAGQPILAKPPGTIGRLVRWCRRNPRVAGLSGTVLGLMLLLTTGSLIASLKLRSSQVALEERTQAAESAARVAEAAQAAAVESARQAAEQRRITLDTLNELVGSVQTQLERRADTAALRQSLLSKAFEGLQSVTGALEHEEQIDRAMIEAYIKMANIKLEFSDRQSAIDQSSKAIELAEKAVARQPNNLECLRDLANALTTQLEIHYGAFANDKALVVAQRIAEIRERVHELLPDDSSAARALIVIKQRIADVQWNLGDSRQSLESYRNLVAQLDTLQSRVGDKLDLRRDKSVLLNRIGNLLLQIGEVDRAAEIFATSSAVTQTLLKEDPDNIVFRADHAFVLGRLAMLSSGQGSHSQAIEHAQAMLDAYEALIRKEPDRIQFRTLLGSAFDLMHQIQLAKGDWSAALAAEQRSLEVAIGNCERDSSTARYPALAAEAAQRIGDLYLRLGQLEQAEVNMAQAVELMKSSRQATDYAATAMEPVEQSFARSLAGCRLALKGEEACREQLIDQPAARLALAYLAYIDSYKGRPASALKLVREIVNLTPIEGATLLEMHVVAVRTMAHCYQDSDDDVKAELESGIQTSLRTCLEALPQSKAYFVKEPDTQWLLNHAIGKDLLK